jgi:hypothetical protein
MGVASRPRPPRLTWPPLRPAARASSALHSCAVPFSCAARPPLLAISRCFSGDIDAKPRRSLRSLVSTFISSVSKTRKPRRRRGPESPAAAGDPVHEGDAARQSGSRAIRQGPDRARRDRRRAVRSREGSGLGGRIASSNPSISKSMPCTRSYVSRLSHLGMSNWTRHQIDPRGVLQRFATEGLVCSSEWRRGRIACRAG